MKPLQLPLIRVENADSKSHYKPRRTQLGMAYCHNHREPFGIHLTRDEENGNWAIDYAFALSERSSDAYAAIRASKLRGKFTFPDCYPGCPHCGNRQLIRCNCGELNCFVTHDKDFEPFYCMSCGEYCGDFIKQDWENISLHNVDR